MVMLGLEFFTYSMQLSVDVLY